MPLYEALSDKLVVVLDIGAAYTKFGFNGEYAPRCIIRSEVIDKKTGIARRIIDYKDEQDLYDLLVDFIHMIYFKYALFSPKERSIIIVESLLCPTIFRETLAKVLYIHYEISSLLILPSHLISLSPLGIETALVIDCGYSEAVIIPVSHGLPGVYAWQALPIGSQSIHQSIRKLLIPDNGEKLVQNLSESTIEDIKIRCCFVTKRQRAEELAQIKSNIVACPDVNYPLGGEDVLKISGKVRERAYEILYEEDNDHLCLSTMVLDTLMNVDIHLRSELSQNILLIGGTVMAPGFKERFKYELLRQLKNEDRYQKLKVTSFKFHSPPCKDNYTAWLGGSIYGTTEILNLKAFTRDNYFKENRLPDWANMKDNIKTI